MSFIEIIDLLTFLALSANALLYLPQILLLVKNKNANDVSLLAFTGFDLINIIVMMNGIAHNDKALYLGSLFSVITNSIVVFLIIYYRTKKKIVS